jgi:hypothetical protein
VQLGGSVGDIEMRVHGLPAYRAGERAVLFLGSSEPWSAWARASARCASTPPPVAGWWKVATARAAFNRRAAREIQPAAPEASLPLDELRKRVRKLVSR